MVSRNEVVVKGPDMSSDPLASLPWSLKEANVFWTNACNFGTDRQHPTGRRNSKKKPART